MKDKKTYDFLIIGSGLFGAVFAREMTDWGHSCLVVEKRNHVGGNVYCEQREGIQVHLYGPHIFHTDDRRIWAYVNRFVEFNQYIHSPLANYQNELYNLPFNMHTFYQFWGVRQPSEAQRIIETQKKSLRTSLPRNLKEQAINLVGKDIYEKLIKGYTEKQWGRNADMLPSFIIKRLPVRFNFDNRYFDDTYQGIPVGGYNRLIEGLLTGIEVRTGIDFFKYRDELSLQAHRVVYTGKLDEYFSYACGHLEYRSLRFEHEVMDTPNYQGTAVINYTGKEVPYTRVIEHKHFEFGRQPKTVVTKEYPQEWAPGREPYYPINDEKNNRILKAYQQLAYKEKDVIFGGRLAEYRYYDMHQVIASALTKAKMFKERGVKDMKDFENEVQDKDIK